MKRTAKAVAVAAKKTVRSNTGAITMLFCGVVFFLFFLVAHAHAYTCADKYIVRSDVPNGEVKLVNTGTDGGTGKCVYAPEMPPATLVTGAATAAKQDTGNTTLSTISTQLPASLGAQPAANSLSVTPASGSSFVLGAGSAVAGKFGIDQTTPGTTNLVAPTCIYNTSFPTLTTGTRGEVQCTSKNTLAQTLYAATGNVVSTPTPSNGASTPSTTLAVTSFPALSNGSTFDEATGNINTAALITHTSASAGANSSDQTNYNGRGAVVCTDITAIGSGSVTTNLQIKDAASAKYVTVLSSAAASGTGTSCLTIYPGAATTANVSLSMPLSRTWRVTTSGTFTGVTATVGASVIN